MVIDYFHIFNACVSPAETNTPLIIDTNAVLPFSVARKRFKAIPWRYPQIAQLASDLKLPEFSLRRRGNAQKSPDALALGQRFRFGARKRFNHAL